MLPTASNASQLPRHPRTSWSGWQVVVGDLAVAGRLVPQRHSRQLARQRPACVSSTHVFRKMKDQAWCLHTAQPPSRFTLQHACTPTPFFLFVYLPATRAAPPRFHQSPCPRSLVLPRPPSLPELQVPELPYPAPALPSRTHLPGKRRSRRRQWPDTSAPVSDTWMPYMHGMSHTATVGAWRAGQFRQSQCITCVRAAASPASPPAASAVPCPRAVSYTRAPTHPHDLALPHKSRKPEGPQPRAGRVGVLLRRKAT